MQTQQTTTSNQSNPPQSVQDDEIDLMELAMKLWDRRMLLIKVFVFFVLIGLFVAVFSPAEFTASSTFIPQSAGGKKAGALGGLASLAGINMDAAGDGQEITPSLYPQLVSAVKFRKVILQAQVTNPTTGKPISYAQYYEDVYDPGIISTLKKYSLGLPGLLLTSIKGTSEPSIPSDTTLIYVTADELTHFKRLDAQLTVAVNQKEGFVELSFVMPDGVMAAQMALAAQKLLQDEVISFRIRNAKEQLLFTEERYVEKKKDFESAQRRLAAYRDINKNINSASAQSEVQVLEAEFNLAFSVYNELANQLEQAKLQVSRDTPVFSNVKSVSVPTEKSAPKRPLILLIFAMLGVILGISWVFVKDFFISIHQEWLKKKEVAQDVHSSK